MKSILKNLFSSNVKLKAMALVLALLSWYIVNIITNYDKTIANLDLNVDLPDGWAVLGKTSSDFQVTFRGTKEDLLLIDDRTVLLNADLTDGEFDKREYETTRQIRLGPRNVTHNSKARVAEIDPSLIEVRIGLEGQKQLPLRVNLTGDPVLGMQVETIVTDPPRVTLYGASERLEAITALQTSPLNLSDRVGSFEQRVDVLPPTADWVGRVEPSRVLVRVTLVGLTEDRRFTGIPVRLYRDPAEGPMPDLIPNPALVDVSLQGSPALLDALDVSEIRAFAEAGPDTNGSRVFVNIPAGLEVLDVNPARVRLRPRPLPTPIPALPPTETGSQEAPSEPENEETP